MEKNHKTKNSKQNNTNLNSATAKFGINNVSSNTSTNNKQFRNNYNESNINLNKNSNTKNYKNKDIIRPSVHGKYNLNFIDWNNEWERVSEIEMKIENGEEISDKEEEERVRSHMIEIQALYSPGVSIENFLLISKPDRSKECYICLKNFSLNSKIRKLPCNHMFCEVCLIPWLKSNYVCPTCKYKLKNEEEEEDIYNY